MQKVEEFPLSSSTEAPFVEIELGWDTPSQVHTSPHHLDQAAAVIYPLPQPEPANCQLLQQNHVHNQYQIYPEWLSLIMGFCFTAIGLGFQCQNSSGHLSISSDMARLALVVSLAAFVISKYVSPNSASHARVLEYAGVFCGATAFFLVITVSFPLCLKLISWTIYVISIIWILLSHSFSKNS
ncbi:hypothetical protein ACH5RR_025077 [Cinchona calisaya]|uniref:Uncharacterized protein n=1 Tax=Cinchona calisaya TaxID=153742 RepID=A0ABD2YYL1_9GENT